MSVPNSVELRDDSGSNSSMVTESMQLQNWDHLEVSFSFIGVGMDFLDDFYLELSTDGGANYTIIERWIADQSQSQSQFQLPASVKWFTNNVRYTETITIPYWLSNNTKLRFRCDASNNWDRVYIDNVVIRGCPNGSPKTSSETLPNTKIDESGTKTKHFRLYPNPVQNTLNLLLPKETSLNQENFDLSVFSVDGERVIYKKLNAAESLQIDVSQLDNNQIYLLHFKTSDQKVYSSKFMKK